MILLEKCMFIIDKCLFANCFILYFVFSCQMKNVLFALFIHSKTENCIAVVKLISSDINELHCHLE